MGKLSNTPPSTYRQSSCGTGVKMKGMDIDILSFFSVRLDTHTTTFYDSLIPARRLFCLQDFFVDIHSLYVFKTQANKN